MFKTFVDVGFGGSGPPFVRERVLGSPSLLANPKPKALNPKTPALHLQPWINLQLQAAEPALSFAPMGLHALGM